MAHDESVNIDLARFHQPVSDLFAALTDEKEVHAARLDDQQVAFFHQHGYLSGVRVLSDDQLVALRSELTQLCSQELRDSELWYEYHTNESTDPDLILFHALGAWRLRPGFHDALWNPAFCVPASQLLSGPVRFWHDQLFCKPARHGGPVAWHQDYSYWTRTKPMAHLTCWIGLDDSTPENGCLHYIPGSHQWDLLPMTELAGDMNAVGHRLTQSQREQFQSPVPIQLKAGECSFHHPLMVHGSLANRTDQPRRALVLNVVRDGVVSDSDEPLLAGTEVIARGQPLGGRFFPLLFHPPTVTHREGAV